MTLSVLVVEDQEAIRQALEGGLTDGGFTVITVENGEKAMRILDSSDSDIRALLTDVNLPGKFSGWDVARHAREVNDQIPIIYVTGASAHEWAAQGVPGSVLLTKPFAIAQAVTAVSQLINAGAALP